VIRAALIRLIELLRSTGLVAQKAASLPASIAAELRDFDSYLTEVRGLVAVTRQARLQHAGDFLLDHFGDAPIRMCVLKPAQIMDFMIRYTAGWKPSSVKTIGISLRSYLRYKAISGIQTTALIAALPHVAQWRLARLPKGLSTQEVQQLLDAFDRSTASGRRDYAIARCYVDLGLRTAEIVRLQLDDLDWSEGVVHIRGKGRRTDRLPLPATTGKAIVAYLRKDRRDTTSRALFLRHRPPLDQPAGPDTIRAVVRNAAHRCGLSTRLTGPHILRHTLACRLVQSGVSLKAIADLLRHRSLDTTTIYAKFDLNALATVAAQWPGRRA
jgi:integrase